MSPLVDLVREITSGPLPAEPPGGVEQWWQAHRELEPLFRAPIDRALVGGLRADRVGYAFAAGYREALVTLVPDVAGSAMTILAATEDQGARPSAIRTTLATGDDGTLLLNGHKRWATLGTVVDVLLVVASEGAASDGRNRLRLCRVDARREGVEVRPMPAPPFAPEIPHAEIALRDVRIEPSDVLPGDGWDAYVKPFRTVEDVHVHIALLGYMAGVARRWSFADQVIEDIVASVVALRSLANEPPSAPEVHVALAGVLLGATRLIERTEHEMENALAAGKGDVAERERWVRDRPLLGVAGGARVKRREVAWQRLRASPAAPR
jgi:acyl-CoA dehydrogenase